MNINNGQNFLLQQDKHCEQCKEFLTNYNKSNNVNKLCQSCYEKFVRKD